MRLAAASPFGPAFMSNEWRSDARGFDPGLVSVLFTRALRDGTFVAASALVDRTCLGVKDGFVRGPMTRAELDDLLAGYEDAHPNGFEEVSVLEAQSVVFHAIDFAGKIGFAAHRDFAEALVGPRPAELLDTPLAYPTAPRYLPGPYDPVRAIEAKVEAYVARDALENAGPGYEGVANAAAGIWTRHFEEEFADVVDDALEEYYEAVLGRTPDPKKDAKELLPHETSLPVVWASFFRPMPDGRTGLELARAYPPLRGHATAAALSDLARARVLFGDVVTLNRTTRVAKIRDAFDGVVRSVELNRSAMATLTRWTRVFCMIVPRADGIYRLPSTFEAHPWLCNVAPADFITRLAEALTALGHRETIDPADPQRGLVRWVGIAHGVLRRMIAPTAAQAAEMGKKMFFVNSDGERLVLHEAMLSLDAALESSLLAALGQSSDFREEGDSFSVIGAPSGPEVMPAERLATIERAGPGQWRIFGSSSRRYEGLVAKLEALAGAPLSISNLALQKPWEIQQNVAAEESENTKRVVIASAYVEAPTLRAAKAAARNEVLDAPFRALDADVPAVGGKPRDVVATPEGRTRVEEWLREWERNGMPTAGGAGSAFIDLDPVRLELGLPTVAEELRRAT